jgi:trichothecene 3-O-acetyltransferase
MCISSMIMLPFASLCFGGGIFGNGGVPEAMRPLMGGLNRSTRFCFVLPRKRNGGIEFVGNLFVEEMEVLLEDEDFGRYAMRLC